MTDAGSGTASRGDTRQFSLTIRLHGDLPLFTRARADAELITRQLGEKTSVKDAIDACGVPHPEIDVILVDGVCVDFGHQLLADAVIEVFPVGTAPELCTTPRLQMRSVTRFGADGHLGKLVRELRLLGIDVLYDRNADDRELVEIAAAHDRGLLTRDRRLLMHAAVRHGYWLRSQVPEEQTMEVIRRFELSAAITPFTRCLLSNGELLRVDKAAVLERLEPLTKIYYEEFQQCASCGQVYWAGTHASKLQARIAAIRAAI